MLEAILKLLPVVGSVVAQLPEFVNLIKSVKDTLSEDDQAVLQSAYELAKQDSDDAHDELKALLAERLA